MFVRKHGARGLIRRQEPRPLPAGLFFLMRLTDAATVVNIGLQLSAGHRRQSRSEGVLGGARDRDRTLRLPVTRERPRAFLRSLGNGRGSFLTLVLSASSPLSGAIADTGEACRMMELLIGTVSWLATLGFIAAIIADTFR
jgi:hypothetical protein